MSKSNLFSQGSENLREIVRADHIYLWDNEGKRYIDGSSGPFCVNIGHGVKEVAEAVQRQMNDVSYAHITHCTTKSVKDCAKRLALFAPEKLNHVYFSCGGSEAIEAAAKMARQYYLSIGESKRYKIIARWQSFHGNTLGALSISGSIARRVHYLPMLMNIPHIPPAYCYRCWFGKTQDTCDLECARALDTQIKETCAEQVSAFIAEPIVGTTLGIVPAPNGYFQLVREICDEHGVLFIADEVMTGIGRTGKRWGLDHWDTIPDIVAAGKGLAGGYLPLGATIASDKVYEAFSEPFAHTQTYENHPVNCAAGTAVLEYMIKHNLVKRSEELGEVLHKGLRDLLSHPSVGDVRGFGLFAGIEFVEDKKSKKPFSPETKYSRRIVDQCLRNGLLVYPGSGSVDGVRGDHIQIAPPLVVKREEIDDILQLLEISVTEVEKRVLNP